MNVIELTQKLISIPSFVRGNNSEKEIAAFVYSYFEKNLPWFRLSKQLVENGRFNIIASDGYEPKIIFLSHLDTVNPSNQLMLQPQLKGKRLYGLGAADMKGGIAASIKALEEIKKTRGVTYIFDCDEEYYFKGIKKLLTEYMFKPDLAICPEPTNLEIVNGCRGVIEIEFDVIGKSAHAGRPQLGVNAIETAVKTIRRLKTILRENDQPELQSTTVNLSTLQGGKRQQIISQGNVVPDIAKVLLDIRPADTSLSAKSIFNELNILAKKYGVKIENQKVNLEYLPYFVTRKNLSKAETAIKKTEGYVKYRNDLGQGGFYESALVSKAWNCPAINFGPAEEGTAHMENEYAEIRSLEKAKDIYKEIILAYT